MKRFKVTWMETITYSTIVEAEDDIDAMEVFDSIDDLEPVEEDRCLVEGSEQVHPCS